MKSKSIYEVYPIKSGMLEINGLGDQSIWEQALPLTDFIYPWNEGQPPAMSFMALHDEEKLYGLYKVIDPKKINIYTSDDSKPSILKSDRVEIFFRSDEHMNPYYGLEMDPLSRIFDFESRYYRQSNRDWTWPQGHLIVKSNLNPAGYTLEFAISKSSLIKLNLLDNNKIEVGLYRGECISLNEDAAEFKWISWIKPDSPKPDFHIPSSFGEFILL